MRALKHWVLAVVGLIGPALASCGDDGEPGPGGGEEACSANFTGLATAPAVSFRNDVMPIFVTSCAVSDACHNGVGREAQLYLGEKSAVPLTDANVNEAHAAIVGRASVTASAVLLVAPGDPDSSFLVDKLLDRQHDRGHVCVPQDSRGVGPCGDVMPLGNSLCMTASGPAKIETIATWIAQGARND